MNAIINNITPPTMMIGTYKEVLIVLMGVAGIT
jgi:hypothetical protein